jgi:hypothetical protein
MDQTLRAVGMMTVKRTTRRKRRRMIDTTRAVSAALRK